jgi:hypothetical protein
MNHPDNDVLHGLLSNELLPAQRQAVLSHIQSCPDCAREVRELLLVYRSIASGVLEETCVADDELIAFAGRRVSPQDAKRIEEHVAGCIRCHERLEVLTASGAERVKANEEWRREFQDALAADTGRRAATAAMRVLLPGSEGLVDALWDKIVAWLSSVGTDPRRRQMQQPELLVGVGFTGGVDAETRAGAIIVATALNAASELARSAALRDQQQMADYCRRTAAAYGAGKELASRLSETLPPTLLQ